LLFKKRENHRSVTRVFQVFLLRWFFFQKKILDYLKLNDYSYVGENITFMNKRKFIQSFIIFIAATFHVAKNSINMFLDLRIV
jgi:hypothetical protein